MMRNDSQHPFQEGPSIPTGIRCGGSIVTVQTIGAFKDAKMIGAGGSKECRVIHIEDEQYTGGRGGTCHAVAAGGGGTDNSVVTLKHSGETSGEIWGVGVAHARDVPPIGGGYAAPPATEGQGNKIG